MPDEEEVEMLREESEALAAFLHLLQREYRQLQADFVAVLQAAGGDVRLPAMAVYTVPDLPRIERLRDPTGTVTFRLKEPTP